MHKTILLYPQEHKTSGPKSNKNAKYKPVLHITINMTNVKNKHFFFIINTKLFQYYLNDNNVCHLKCYMVSLSYVSINNISYTYVCVYTYLPLKNYRYLKKN